MNTRLSLIIVAFFISVIYYNCSAPVNKKEKDLTENSNNRKAVSVSNTSQLKNDPTIRTINIGLMISEYASKSELSRAAIQGAELAIMQANLSFGGYNGIPFNLVTRSCDGPWGIGSKETVNLIYEDSVCAIIASLNGRNAHLVEQVATKAHIVMLSSRATDPTLSQAFVPWYFRIVPNDIQQANTLVEKIVTKKNLNNITAISDNGYDGKLASDNFIKQIMNKGYCKPTQLLYDYLKPDFKTLLDQIENTGVQNIILFGKPETAHYLMQKMNERKLKLNIFSSLSILGEEETLNKSLRYFENMVMISSNHWFTPEGKKFQKHYQNKYGYQAGAIAAYAYDGANLIIEAILKNGVDRELIRDYLAKIKYQGVTGLIQFDDKGNRKGNPNLMQIQNGIPAIIEED